MSTVRTTLRTTAAIALLAGLAVLPACGADQRDRTPDAGQANAEQEDDGVISRAIGSAITEAVTEARQEIRSGNIGISTDDNGDRPKAEISPQGDLLIDGKAVAINDQQRALLLDYRTHIAGIAESGMEIGLQGADLAQKAVGEAFKGILTGKSEAEIEKSVEAEAATIKQAAAKLCARLPAMMASQQKAAAAIPEFRPYATMTQDDINECMDETKASAVSRNAADEAAEAARQAN